MPTNHYECTKCGKPCDVEPKRAHPLPHVVREVLSTCCAAPVVVRSGKDW